MSIVVLPTELYMGRRKEHDLKMWNMTTPSVRFPAANSNI